MGRGVLAGILVAGLAALPVRADVETWHPKLIFTESHCAQELSGGLADLKEKLAEKKIVDPGEDSKDKAAVKVYVKALKQADGKTAKRARFQASAAGKWKGKTQYAIYKWKHKKYRVTSCQPAKIKIPLKRALRIVSAVPEPTKTDLVIAEEIKEYIKLKKVRKACRLLRPWPTARKCLEANPGEWLDRYPVN